VKSDRALLESLAYQGQGFGFSPSFPSAQQYVRKAALTGCVDEVLWLLVGFVGIACPGLQVYPPRQKVNLGRSIHRLNLSKAILREG